MWDAKKACRMLCIPYRVREKEDNAELLVSKGFSSLKTKNIVICKEHENDNRVWAHEIAHSLLHVGDFDLSGKGESVKEIEADTVAYLVLSELGETREDYSSYIKWCLTKVPHSVAVDLRISEERMEVLKKTAKLILRSGGYKYGN